MTTVVVAKATNSKVSARRNASAPPASSSPVHRGADQAHRSAPFPSVAAADSETKARKLPREAGRELSASAPLVWKRCLDIFCVLVSLPVTLPLMAVIALWVRCVSRGPALFRQERIGRNGKSFVLYKFRSMKLNADTRRHQNHFRHLVRSDSPMIKLDLLCDSRLIPAGCLLRAAGLDELPQLLNVLRGEMSLVGPRPCLPEEFRFFTAKQRERFQALPGLTGIWQVHGKGASTFSEMNAMDVLYVRRSSLVLDLSIMVRTPLALFRQMAQAFQQHRASTDKPNLEAAEGVTLSGCGNQRLG